MYESKITNANMECIKMFTLGMQHYSVIFKEDELHYISTVKDFNCGSENIESFWGR